MDRPTAGTSDRDRDRVLTPIALRNAPLGKRVFAAIAIPFGLFVAAMFTRVVSWHSVFLDAGVHPSGNDAYYHLRRIRYSVEHFPDVLRFDPLMNYPHGGQPIWSPTFDWLIAASLIPFPGILEADRLDRLAVWYPPVLGALTVLLLYYMAKRFFSGWVALLASLVLIVLPGHVLYSRLGMVDHHVLVALTATAMLWVAMELFRVQERDSATLLVGEKGADGESGRVRVRLALSVVLGVVIACVVLVWPGALLHVGIVQLALVIRLLTTRAEQQAWTRSADFGIAHAIAAFIVYPFAAGQEWVIWGSASPVVLSDFQPLYLSAAAVVFGVLALLWRSRFWAKTAGERAASAAGLGAIVCAGLFLAIPDLLLGIEDALSWFSKDEEFQAAVNESQPLVWANDGPWRAHTFLGAFVYGVPLLLGVFGWHSRRDPARLLLIGWSAAFFAASLVQWRFVNTYSIVHGVLIAWSVVAIWNWAKGQKWPTAAHRLFLAALVILTLATFVPALHSYAGDFKNIMRVARGEAPRPIGPQRDASLVTAAARFLKAYSPKIDTNPYSVIGPWGVGHIIKYVAERPVLQDNFGDDVAPENFALVEAYFSAGGEAAALELVAPLDVRFVMVRSVGSGHSPGYAPDSLLARLYTLRGRGRPASKQEGREVPQLRPLEQHRLIYESRSEAQRKNKREVMLFEIVEGANVVGRAQAGLVVRASLTLLPQNAPAFEYQQETIADASGHYRFRVPYSNENSRANVRVGRNYRIATDREVFALVVPESAVVEGGLIEGPAFDSRASSGDG